MKLPERPPRWTEYVSGKILDTPALDSLIARANSDYLYWDDFKYKPIPEGFSPEESWARLKIDRAPNRQHISFSGDVSFSYIVTPAMAENLHLIDRNAGGIVLTEDAESLRAERERYMIRSLAEEAIASSQIEGAVTTRTAAKEMLRSGRDPKDYGERMIFNNYKTIELITRMKGESLSIELINQLHAEISRGTLDDPSWEGRLRTEQNEVHDIEDHVVLYTPPRPDAVPDAMRRLCNFANDDSNSGGFVHPAIKGIILHFWLVWIHPYMDGNGRVARALFYWYMLRQRYWLFKYLAISDAIKRKRIQYYKSLLYSEADDNDMTYFVHFNLGAIREAVNDMNEYIDRKEREKREASVFLSRYPTLNTRQRALLASAIDNPNEVYDFTTHSRVHGVVYQSGRNDLLGLQALGLLVMRKSGNKMLFYPVENLREKLTSRDK